TEKQQQHADRGPAGAAGRRFRATQTAGQRDTAAAAAKGSAASRKLPKMGALQLDRLTKLNTRRNSTYMTCQIERVVEVRAGERPPSPSLLMQVRAHERRLTAGLDTGNDYRSIYSDSSSDGYSTCGDSEDDPAADPPAMAEDTCPLSPLPATAAIDGSDAWGVAAASPAQSAGDVSAVEAAPDAKRKSTELAGSDWEDVHEMLGAEAASDDDGPGKRRCREPRGRVRWGVRSVLRAPWLQGRAPPPAAALPPPILVRRANEEDLLVPLPPPPTTTRGKRQPSKLAVVKVVAIQYPESTGPNLGDDDNDDNIEDIPDESPDEEYVPRRSSRRGGSRR
ncbi:hypothetical protein IWQ57_001979, partial [Coemansia nantahalensis]